MKVRTFTDEPLRKAFCDFRTKLVVDCPSPPFTVVPKETKLSLSALNKKLPLFCIKAFHPLL